MDAITIQKLNNLLKWITRNWTSADWENMTEAQLFESLQMWAVDLEDESLLDDEIAAEFEFEQHMGW